DPVCVRTETDGDERTGGTVEPSVEASWRKQDRPEGFDRAALPFGGQTSHWLVCFSTLLSAILPDEPHRAAIAFAWETGTIEQSASV
ncbi:hypothetical protein, partial [Pararhizobium mangrovi]|uniref:hypothetical protein n=1 Tax=Pararhizobium mangrovi TaxID=2590452 RepID=UPI001AED2F37